jgi:pentatricopeptide repeat protein
MLNILHKARSAKKAIQPWSNPEVISQEITAILSQCRFPSKTFSTSLSSPPSLPSPPTTTDNQSTTPSTTTTATALKKQRNAAYQDFKRLLVRGQPAAAAAALETYHRCGGAAARPLYHSLMELYSRKGDPESVVNILNTMISTNNPPPNQHSFGYCISALKKSITSSKVSSSFNKEATTAAAAHQALQLFETMISGPLNLAPNSTLYNELIDCFGRAGDVEQAFKLFQRAVAVDHIQPTVHTFSILIKACAIAKQPDRANDVVFKLMPQHGLVPGPAAWNGLLGAAAQGSVDRAYDVWQKMIDAGIVPDIHTERVLAKAFASHPQLAAELVAEARSFSSFEGGKSLPSLSLSSSLLEEEQPQQHQSNSDDATAASSSGSAASNFTTSTSPSKQQPILLNTLKRKKNNKISGYTLGMGSPSAFKTQTEVDEEEENTIHFLIERKIEHSGGTPPKQGKGEERGDGENEQQREDTPLHVSHNRDTINTTAVHLSKLLSLDLHGHSQAAAEMSLLNRLEALVEAWPKISRNLEIFSSQHASSNDTTSIDPPTNDTTNNNDDERRGLVIITGVGKGSGGAGGVLKSAVHAMLQKQGLSAVEVPTNPGRLFVSFDQISNFAEKQWERMQRDHFYAAARVRYGAVGFGVAGLVAAAVILPRLGPWLT